MMRCSFGIAAAKRTGYRAMFKMLDIYRRDSRAA
jgi:hypothetical protein